MNTKRIYQTVNKKVKIFSATSVARLALIVVGATTLSAQDQSSVDSGQRFIDRSDLVTIFLSGSDSEDVIVTNKVLMSSMTVMDDLQETPAGTATCPPPSPIIGNLGTGGTNYPSTSGIQTGRLAQTGVHSSCAAPKTTPGILSAGQPFAYDAYEFVNGSSAACITFTFPASCGVNQAIHPVAYLGSFNPANPATNYLGDFGQSINASGGGTFSVTVPANATVILVVHRIGTVDGCPNYNFTVGGLLCPVPDTTVGLSGGVLTVTDADGGTSTDNLTVSCSGSNLNITDPSNTLSAGSGTTQIDPNTVRVPKASVSSIVANTLAGNDRLTMDLGACSGSVPTTTFNGGNPTNGPGDALRVLGGSFASGASTPTNGQDGSIVYTGGTTGNFTLNYTGLEPIDDLSSVTNYTINGTNGLNFLNIVNGPVVSGTQTTQVNDGADLIELINFANKTNVTINALDGSDQISINNSLKGVGLTSLIVNGNNGNDQFSIHGPGTVAGVGYTLNGGSDNELFSVSGGLLSASITVNGDTHTGGTPSTQDRLTVNSFASNVTQTNTQLLFSGGSAITLGTLEQINLNNLNTLSVSGTAAAQDTIVLSKPFAPTFRSIINGGVEVNFDNPLASVGAQYFANPAAESDTLTVNNVGRVVNLRVAYNAGTGIDDTLNVFGDPGTAVTRETYIVGATQDAGRLVLDPDGNMGFLKTSVVAANGDELDVSFNGLDPINTDVPATNFDVVLSASADNATLANDGVLLNGAQSMILTDNAGTFETTRFTNKVSTTISGFLANDTIVWQNGSISAGLTGVEFNGFLPVGLGADDFPGSSVNRDVVTINEAVSAPRNVTVAYSDTASVVNLSGVIVPLRIGTTETVTYAGSNANNDLMTIIDKTSAVDPARVFNLTANGASYMRNGGPAGGDFGPDLTVSGIGGSALPLTLDGNDPTTAPGDRFFYDGPGGATVTPTGPNAGNITAAGLIGVHYQNYERLTTGGAADLSLTKIVDNATPVVGNNVTFTITLTNDGPNAATSVTVQDVLPAGLTFVSSTATQGAYSTGTGIWTVGTVSNGVSRTLQITATIATAGPKLNYAQVMASSVTDPDSTPGDNSTNQDDDDSVTINPVGPTPTPTPTPTATPTATPTPAGTGFEGDVAPRNNGDGIVLSTDVTQMRRFATGLDTVNPAFNEQQRADSAPRTTNGDGIINSGDVIQTRRYATGLDPQTDAGGPTAPPAALEKLLDSILDKNATVLRLTSAKTDPGSSVGIVVEILSHGNCAASSFTLEFDPSKLTNPRIALAQGVSEDTVLTVNTDEWATGRIGILVDSDFPIASGPIAGQLVNVTFDVAADAGSGDTPARFSDALAPQSVSDSFADLLAASFTDGVISISDKAVIETELSGRVVTTDGQGIRNAVVTLTDSYGVERSVSTGAFGYYRFGKIGIGETYIIGVRSRLYRFDPLVLHAFDNLTDVNLIARE
jgi:uncharacterized repeat protein (TIGR01451 family)